ncbi:hypothetical protein J8F10_29740 [Gemmata sp. G18]|uniref:Uncharacterized protein n=1 Tax=Gemmata palustris TaxID=2822762 RepID=A0ABS5C0C5_9BACT|nr:hypothetical protein [Gemmata palustris]MBP3959447.1 hypothetical protein [Gemmata palustris]
MPPEAQSDIALIERTLSQQLDAPEPAPRQRVRPTVRKAEPIAPIGDDDDDEADDGSDLEGLLTAPVIPPPRAPAVIGLPDVEGVPGVISARAAEADIQAKRKALGESKGALLTALSLPAGAGERELDKRQVALIVAGADETDIEKLRALYKREKLLTEAASVAAGATQDAIRKARSALAEEAEATLYVPALREAAAQYLNFVAAGEQLRSAVVQLTGAGMRQLASMFASGPVPADMRDQSSHMHLVAVLNDLIGRGALTTAEVDMKLPGILPR